MVLIFGGFLVKQILLLSVTMRIVGAHLFLIKLLSCLIFALCMDVNSLLIGRTADETP